MAKQKGQYPDDFQPPHRGHCEWLEYDDTAPEPEHAGPWRDTSRHVRCNEETRAYARQWLTYCPRHWKALEEKWPIGRFQKKIFPC